MQAVAHSNYDGLTDRLFGTNFSTRLEPQVFHAARELSAEYVGGTWNFFALSNGGFFMSPRYEILFEVSCASGAKVKMSAEAFGISVCQIAFSRLSFCHGAFAETSSRHYYLLRAFMFEHLEAPVILAATD